MFAKLFLKACNSLLNLIVACALAICGAYAVYALWDNNQILAAAENVQVEMQKLKPDITEQTSQDSDNTESFAQLLQINADVCGWVSMDGTQIDYPILYGDTNMEYINKDVYGNFALAGSIFLDSRNDNLFGDAYSLLYGHHMADSRMFGDLELYKEEAFFRENRTGILILPHQTYDLEVISCMLVGSFDEYIFEPESTRDDIQSLLDFVEENALFSNDDVLARARQTEGLQILALSTCSSEFTDARTIVLTVMVPHTAG